MTNNKNKIYNLEERTAKFGEDIITFAKKISKNVITIPIIGQLVRAGQALARIIAKPMTPNLEGLYS